SHSRTFTEPDVTAFNHSVPSVQPINGFAFFSGSLHKMVGYSIKLDNKALSLQSHYEPSSLLLAISPLCPASILSFSWGHHLNLSLTIGTTCSNVPRERGSDSSRLEAGSTPGSRQMPTSLILI